VIHYQFYENILNWCHMDKAKFKMVFLKTHPAYKYATSDFWDFSQAGKSNQSITLPVGKTLQIDKKNVRDTFSLHLPPMVVSDSTWLLNIDLRCKMPDEINESFVRFLLSDGEKYVDMQNLLLLRKVNHVDQYQEIDFEMWINKPVSEGKLHISLESVDEEALTTLEVLDIQLRKIKF
jgi:hypothetical protein